MNDRLARVSLMRLAEPDDTVMGRLVAAYGPEAAVAQIRAGRLDPEFVRWFADVHRNGSGGARGREEPMERLDRLLASWSARLEGTDPGRDLAEGERTGARLITPGSPEWPTQLDDLEELRPRALWLWGEANLRLSCVRSVAVVGSRAATPYGAHIAAEFGAELGSRGYGVVSGGAYGIDGAAHRGALAGGTPTVAVLACGVDVTYPSAHHDLFAAVREQGVLVSECPMGVRPTRPRFLIRNRLIAALSRGTVIVEAAVRSGAINTAATRWRSTGIWRPCRDR
nr:hypothetical protein GCM10020093_099830 [Planobispora longispora]